MAKRKAEPIQIIEGKKYLVAHGGEPFLEECCGCGLTHRIVYSLENGQLWAQYYVEKVATKAARKRRGITLTAAD